MALASYANVNEGNSIQSEAKVWNSVNSILRTTAQEISFRPQSETKDGQGIAGEMRRVIEQERQTFLDRFLMEVIRAFHDYHLTFFDILAGLAEFAGRKVDEVPQGQKRGMILASKLLTVLSEESLDTPQD